MRNGGRGKLFMPSRLSAAGCRSARGERAVAHDDQRGLAREPPRRFRGNVQPLRLPRPASSCASTCAPRGWHRMGDADRPTRTPPKTLALLSAAHRVGLLLVILPDWSPLRRDGVLAGTRWLEFLQELQRG